MFKKLILMALSVAALVAFAVPAAASAEGPLITNSLGGAAETIEATSSNTVSTTPAGELKCTTVNLHIELAENENTTAQGAGTGTGEGNPNIPTDTGTCVSSSGLGVHITSVTVSNIHMTKHGGETTGTANFAYTYDLYSGSTLVAECTIGGSETVKATGTSTLNISGTLTKTAGTSLCPETGTIKGDFTLDDEFGGAAHID